MSNQTQNRNYTSKTDILDQNYQHDPPDHRRRIKTEEKAKVVMAAWGAALIQFLAVLAISAYFAPGKFEEQDEGGLYYMVTQTRIH